MIETDLGFDTTQRSMNRQSDWPAMAEFCCRCEVPKSRMVIEGVPLGVFPTFHVLTFLKSTDQGRNCGFDY
jgi:hypothetical protein